MQETYSYRFVLISVIYVTALMVANTVASKLVLIGPFVITGGIVIFPLTYIFGDILTEVYGYRKSRRIIWLGFLSLVIMVAGYMAVQALPHPAFWTNQEAYESILGFVPRIVIASMIGYLVGEFSNSVVMSIMKVRMKGRALWMRTIGSTIVGEGVDTLIFVTIAFAGILAWGEFWQVVLSGYVLKVAYEVIATPITYKIVKYLKKTEDVDVYDHDVNYSPFVLT